MLAGRAKRGMDFAEGDTNMEAVDRRRFRRFMLNLPVYVRRVQSRERSRQAPFRTHTKDISRGGIYFEVPGDCGVGSHLELLVQVPFPPFGNRPTVIRCRGKVVRSLGLANERTGVAAVIDSVRLVPPPRSLDFASPPRQHRAEPADFRPLRFVYNFPVA